MASKWTSELEAAKDATFEQLKAEGLGFYDRELAYQWANLRDDLRMYEEDGDLDMIDQTAMEMDQIVERDEMLEALATFPYEPESITEASGEVF